MRSMLHPSPLAAVDQIQIVQPFVQCIAKGTVEIAIQKKHRCPASITVSSPKTDSHKTIHKGFCAALRPAG